MSLYAQVPAFMGFVLQFLYQHKQLASASIVNLFANVFCKRKLSCCNAFQQCGRAAGQVGEKGHPGKATLSRHRTMLDFSWQRVCTPLGSALYGAGREHPRGRADGAPAASPLRVDDYDFIF